MDKTSQNEVENLLHVFNKYRNVKFPDIMNQLKNKFSVRVEIDKTILKILGFNDDEINKLLDYLYPALANEIEQLKTLMQG